MKFIRLIVIFAVFLSACGCNPEKPPFSSGNNKRYILVYSSAALSNPVIELASEYEKNGECAVDILTGGSAHQMRAIQVNKKGDVIFATVGDYVDILKTQGMVSETYELGSDRLAYFVAYGNPLKIDGKLDWLTNDRIRGIIGSALTSGAGEETHRALQKAGVLKNVFENVTSLASDSKQLLKAVADNNADIAVDWISLKYNPQSEGTQTVEIDSPYFREVKVKAGLITFSQEQDCAKNFLEFAASEKGRQVFLKYGIEK
ncbi:substrate-binding domain-containing protein [Seleniivibrio sp.]|uniref:substrate-binding domain-containing protein n=1 Tax=Seleniivibrio sp. TaxID=2898801 RepID=UPI0025F90D34|nr:substrate-binding domain-containing protein [Seleniivibrio sp.]MCD8552894.1 substrate-binding domain-containing protein [Seleniivibrio sp.]